MRFGSFSNFPLAACLALCASGAAFAQTAGTYSGTTADGNPISMTVMGSGSDYAVTGFTLNYTADCAHSGSSLFGNFASGANFPLTNGAADFSLTVFQSVYTFGSLHFVGNHTIKGTITTDQAAFDPGSTPPKRAEFCESPKQAFTMDKGAPADAQTLKPVVAVTRAADKQ
jgi:hypothetical protein